MLDWFRRKRKDGRERWCDALSPAQEMQFEALVAERLAATGHASAVENGYVVIRGETCGLTNLAQVCTATPQDDWASRIAEHFDALDRAAAESVDWEERKEDYDWVAPQLRVRLQPAEFDRADGTRASIAEMAVVRADLPGIPTVLVVDRPSAVVTVAGEMPAIWRRASGELFDTALANVAARCSVNIESVEIDPESGMRVFVLEGDDFFVSSHALRIDAWPQLVGIHGTLLGVPNRHSLVAFPIETPDVMSAIPAIAWMTHQAHEAGPGSISPNIFWRTRDGRYAVLVVEIRDEAMHLTTSDEFKQLLERVTG